MAQVQETRFSCTCGTVTGHIRNFSQETGTHIRCFCPDCRAAERYFDQPDPGSDGIDFIQLNASDIVFDSGLEHLALMRLYPTGLLRWYAGCCHTPLFNTVATPKVRFASLPVARMEDPEQAGPVRARAFVPGKNGKTRHEHIMRSVWPILTRSLSGLITGEWRETPFFETDTRAPIRPAKVLNRAERAAIGLKQARPPR